MNTKMGQWLCSFSRRFTFLYGCLLLVYVVALFPCTIANKESQGNRDVIQYETKYFTQKVDHFSFANQDSYKQRYLIADQFWDKEAGPIFFYTGNEGDIAWFCNNTGLMWDWAPEFKALLVFAEHRYYGESMPYGNQSYDDVSKLGYLSAEQALADFATLIDHLKSTVDGASEKPVIAFGGSYGGMLAAWFRMKYPHVVQGSLAASAPILMFGDLVPCEAFYKTVTQDFMRESTQCVKNIMQSWDTISDLGNKDSGLQFLKSEFGLCGELQSADIAEFKSWIMETYVNLAMMDYPYETSFMEPLPGWPIKVACQSLMSDSLSGKSLVSGVAKAIKMYYNYTGSVSCLDIKQQASKDLGDRGWDFQACTEMVMPMCTDGINDMFEPSPWDYKSFSEDCQKNWGVTPRPDWILKQFGGRNISAASNIIFSNGDLDPWRVGGVLETISDSLVAINIPEGAHHLDLRSANPHDPQGVIAARNKEKEIIQGWLEEHRQSKDNSNGIDSSKGVAAPGVENIEDMVLVVGVFLFVLGAVILFFYLGLAQNVRSYLRRRQSAESPPIDQTSHVEPSTTGFDYKRLNDSNVAI